MSIGDGAPLIWIPRPIEDAATIADEVRLLGYETLVEPVMTIRYHDIVPDLEGVAALVFTSANGVRAFVRLKPDRYMPVFAVGPQCAEVASEAGFTSITVAGGDVEKLAETIVEYHKPADGKLLHIAASELAGDLAGSLATHGLSLDRAVLYSAETSEQMPERVAGHLRSGAVSGVLLFSPRTAATVESLVKTAGLSEKVAQVRAICLSQAVADKLSAELWQGLFVAKDRNRQSMIDVLEHTVPKHSIREDTAGSDSSLNENNQEKYGTAATSTPTLSTDTKRTHHEGTEDNEKTEGASGSMNAEHVIEQFGGIRPMAQKMGIAVSTVQGWKGRNHIPENRWEDVRAAAVEAGIELDEGTVADDAHETDEQVNDTGSPWGSESEESTAATDQEGSVTAQDAEEPATNEASESDEKPQESEEKPEDTASADNATIAAVQDKKEQDTKPAVTPPPPPVQKPARSSGSGWALFFALVALAGIATRGYWGPAVDPKVEAHLTNFFGPPVEQKASAVDETIQTDLVRTQEVIAAMLKRVEDIESRAEALGGSLDGGEVSSVAIDAINDRITALEDRLNSAPTISEDGSVDLEALESALAALRNRMGSLDGKADASIETFQLEINTFGDRLAAMGDDLASANTLLDSLGERLRQIEEAPGNPTINSSAMVLAIGQLEIVADSGAPFADMLPGLTTLAGDDAETGALIEGLKGASWEGVTTVSALSSRFSDIALIVDAAETSAIDGDWVDESLAALQSVVSIRRIDEAPDAPAASKAERALARGDLASAVALVTPFAEADQAIADWLNLANARLAVDTAITQLRARAVDRLRAMATTN